MDRRIVRRFSVAWVGSLRLGTKGDRSTTEESGGRRRSGRQRHVMIRGNGKCVMGDAEGEGVESGEGETFKAMADEQVGSSSKRLERVLEESEDSSKGACS